MQFKASATPSKIEHVAALFAEIPEHIPGVLSVEWGVNDSPEGLNQGYTHAVMMHFADEAARQRYLPHPAHEALKAVFVPLIEHIIVLDYTLNPTSSPSAQKRL